MKTPLAKSLTTGLLATAFGISAASAQTLYVQYNFDDPQTGSSIADSGGPGGFTGTITSSTNAYSETNEWVFVAFTADANTDVFNFYKGTTTTGVSLVNTGTIPGIAGNSFDFPGWGPGQTTGGITASFVGNRPDLARRIGVALDDFRIYGAVNDSSDGALSITDLEAIRV
jgi:hypothetical protein